MSSNREESGNSKNDALLASNYHLAHDDGTTNNNSKNNNLSGNGEGSNYSNDMNDELNVTKSMPEAVHRKFHSQCGQVVHSELFQYTILFLIFVNSILTALATASFVRNDPQRSQTFETLDTVFLVVFTGELVLHLFYFGWSFFSDGWLVMDLIIVTGSWAFCAFTVLRAFRIVRAVRLVTHLKEMKDLVAALLKVMPRMGAIFSLLLLIYFIFTVLFTELFQTAYEDGVTSEDYFSTLDLTAFTLLQFMFLDDWSHVTKELMEAYAWAWIPILTFIVICTFIVVNLIIAVICDAVQAIQTDEMSSQLDAMQRSTHETIQQTEKRTRHDMKRLEAKLNQLLQQQQQPTSRSASSVAGGSHVEESRTAVAMSS